MQRRIPDLAPSLGRRRLGRTSHRNGSHGMYRDRTGNGEKLSSSQAEPGQAILILKLLCSLIGNRNL